MGDPDVVRNGISPVSGEVPLLRVNEIFGPTIQGEGPLIGTRAWFVRLAGCDSNCPWCDTKYALSPEAGEWMTASQVAAQLDAEFCTWVCLTGGNPALQDLGDLVRILRSQGFRVSVETQGTVWPEWLQEVDLVVVSPKRQDPPLAQLTPNACLKVVVFDLEDLYFAERMHYAFPEAPLFLQPGTPANRPLDLTQYRWLWEIVSRSSVLRDARLLPQLHVLVWGRRRRV